MTTFHGRLSASVCALFVVGVAHLPSAQDFSRYRDVAFGSSVSAVMAATAANASEVTLVHQRPALIQELAWRPQYAIGRPIGQSESAREVTFRFYDDQLFSIIVVYDARRVEGHRRVPLRFHLDPSTAARRSRGGKVLTLSSR